MLTRIHVLLLWEKSGFSGPARLIRRAGETWYSFYWLFFFGCDDFSRRCVLVAQRSVTTECDGRHISIMMKYSKAVGR